MGLNQLGRMISWTLSHIKGDSFLEPIDPNVLDNLNDPGNIHKLEQTVEIWSDQIRKLVDTYLNKNPAGNKSFFN